MTCLRARVSECFACLGHKFPIVAGGMQDQFENPKSICVAYFAVGSARLQGRVVASARPNHKLTDAAQRVGDTIRRLRGKALVDMIMSVEDQVYIMVIKDLPETPAVQLRAPT